MLSPGVSAFSSLAGGLAPAVGVNHRNFYKVIQPYNRIMTEEEEKQMKQDIQELIKKRYEILIALS